MILQRALAKKKSKWSFACKSILGSIFSFDGRTTTSLEISNQVGFPSVLFAKLFIFPFFLQWNGSTTYEFAIERDFGTDYGICCWYTPQHNLTEVKLHQEQNNLSEPDWGFWFQDLPKVTSKLEMTNFPLKLALKLLKNFLMKMHPS